MNSRRGQLTIGTVLSAALLVGIISYFISAFAFVHAGGNAALLRFTALDPSRNIQSWTVIAFGSLGVAALTIGLVIWYLGKKLVSRS
jgi:hypothetical protein